MEKNPVLLFARDTRGAPEIVDFSGRRSFDRTHRRCRRATVLQRDVFSRGERGGEGKNIKRGWKAKANFSGVFPHLPREEAPAPAVGEATSLPSSGVFGTTFFGRSDDFSLREREKGFPPLLPPSLPSFSPSARHFESALTRALSSPILYSLWLSSHTRGKERKRGGEKGGRKGITAMVTRGNVGK